MGQIKIATDYRDGAVPVYTTTLKLVLGELMETEIDERDAEWDVAAGSLSKLVGGNVLPGKSWEQQTISDAFFNCDFVNERPVAEFDFADRLLIQDCAQRFHAELPEPYASEYTVDWLVQDFFNRL